MNHDRQLTLHFLDGTKISFAFSKQADLEAARQIKIDSLWDSKQLIIEADGNILVFPISSIKYLNFALGSEPTTQIKLPAHTIRGATILG